MSKWIKNDSGGDKTWVGQLITNGSYYQIQPLENAQWANNSALLTDIAAGDAIVAKDDSGSNDITDVNSAIEWLKNDVPKEVAIEGVNVAANRLQIMNNRVPNGYSLFVTGEADDITNGTYGGGSELQFDSSTTEVDFQLLNHFYAIGARAIWKNCDINNYFNATLIAPATTGATNTTGDFNKYEIVPSSGLHMFIPVAANTGTWDMDLAAVKTNTNILKAVPVPAVGNDGWFDYDSATNTVTPNMGQAGGYNLYDFDVNLHAFGRKIWGTPQNGGISELDISDLVGKLLYNSWIVRMKFDISGGTLGSEKVAAMFIIATKKNI